MIYDTLENADRYSSCNPIIAEAFRYIREHKDGKDLADGKYVLIPDVLIANVISGNNRDRKDAMMEVHEKFMDIQYIIEGEEICTIAPLDPTVKMDPEGDIGFWACEDTGSILVRQGEFYIVWPKEPHCPMICNGESKPERKIVCKVRIN